MSIKENLEKIQKEIDTSTVKIIGVTKNTTHSQIIEAYNAGICDFGESRVQEISEKWKNLTDTIKEHATWHFIGHLQRNKVKKVVKMFNLIHSVDTVKLAECISEEAFEQKIVQDILLEVNITEEESKYGFTKNQLVELFPILQNLKNLNIKGLMTMAPFSDNISMQKSCFNGLRQLKEMIEQKYNVFLPELSMGMSNDYIVAVEEGSTIVRIGRKLFT